MPGKVGMHGNNAPMSSAEETNGASTASDSNDTEGDNLIKDPEVNADTTQQKDSEPSGNDGEANGSTSAADSIGEPPLRGKIDRNAASLFEQEELSEDSDSNSSVDSADRKAEEARKQAEAVTKAEEYTHTFWWQAEEAKKAEEALRQKTEESRKAEEARKQAEQNARNENFWGNPKNWTDERTGTRPNHTYIYEKVAKVPVPTGVASVSKTIEVGIGKPRNGPKKYKTVSVAPPAPVTRRRLCDSPVLAALMAEIAACQ